MKAAFTIALLTLNELINVLLIVSSVFFDIIRIVWDFYIYFVGNASNVALK